MKKLTALLLLLTSLSLFASEQQCQDVIRAVNTDQEDMAVGTTLYKYNIPASDVLTIDLADYVSWKEKQLQCLANIRHTATVKVQYTKILNKISMVCDLNVDVKRFDHFLTTISETVYSFENETETCRVEEKLELMERLTCQARPCPYSQGKEYRSVKDDCSCKSIWDYPTFKDHAQDYLDFYNPTKFFLKS